MIFALAVRREDYIEVCEQIKDALRLLRGTTLKDFWVPMGFHEGSTISRSLNAEADRPFDLRRFVATCDPKLVHYVLLRLLTWNNKRMAKADLRSADDERKRA